MIKENYWTKRHRIRRIGFRVSVMLLFILLAMLSPERDVQAAKDTEKPTINVTKETEEMVADQLTVKVTVKDNGKVTEFRYQKGEYNTAYFKNGGGKVVALKNNTRTFQAKNNATYTFYAVDAAGNTRIKKVTISNIDKEAPVITLTTPPIEGYTNEKQYFKVQVSDDLSGIESVKYAYGIQDAAYFAKSGTVISFKQDGSGRAVIKKNSNFTFYAKDKAGHEITYVTNVDFMDTTAPTCTAEYSVLRQEATVTLKTSDNLSGVGDICYQSGTITSTDKKDWVKAIPVSGKKFQVKEAGDYTIRTQDLAGNATLTYVSIEMEFRATWITYIEFAPSFGYTEYTYDTFSKKIDSMFDECVENAMNAVIVQVRPFSDAMYPSAYFPWSGYICGKQGKDPGFDPLAYMVDAAHERGLEFHAYLNPYRVEKESNYSLLSEDNPAKVWLEDKNPGNDRNVLLFNGQYYYNPASKEVREQIVNGVKEIVENYDVDGIHFDDYFYPTLNTNYKKNFDYVEYNDYAAIQKAAGLDSMSIADWRRNNVSTLVSEVYAAIKKIDSSVVFGISPAGNLSNLRADDRNYVDIDRWLSSEGYVDYICPQIYWGFEHNVCPFAETTDKWAELITNPTINLYVGLALYKAGTSDTDEWKNKEDIIARQVQYLRDTGFADGFFLYRQEFLTASRSNKEMQNLLKLLKKD